MNIVHKLDILISLNSSMTGCYNIYFDETYAISERICDPIELVVDISNEYNHLHFDFSNAVISLYTDITCVNQEYVNSNSDMVDGDTVCIYSDTFQNLLCTYNFNLPIPQYCSRLFELYINSCKYLFTIQTNELFNHEHIDSQRV